MTNSDLGLILKENQPLKEFMTMVYLSLSDEINDRVQQTATELKSIHTSKHNDTFDQLMRFRPLLDSRKLVQYNLDNINKINPDILSKFI